MPIKDKRCVEWGTRYGVCGAPAVAYYKSNRKIYLCARHAGQRRKRGQKLIGIGEDS